MLSHSAELVSICIPCRNSAPYIAQAVDSILGQSWPHIEIIIVDDGSTDGTAEILQTYRLPQIHVISESLCSAAKSRNRALSVAQGDWIKFFDADDLLSPLAIERQIERLRDQVTAVASSAWGRFYGDDISTFRLNPQSVWRDMDSRDWLVEAWADAQPMTQPGMFLIPRPLLEMVGGWDESLSLIDDFEFFARLFCHATEVLFADEAILYYRSGIHGSLSALKSRTGIESAFHSLIKGTDYLLQHRSDPDARLSCANILQLFIYDAYPHHPDLRDQIQMKIKQLGGSNLKVPGGPRFQLASRLLGWKMAKRIQTILVRA